MKRFSVLWTEPALADLMAIRADIAAEDPAAAGRVAQALIAAGDGLQTRARRGRPGRASGTRELILAEWPWIMVYEVAGPTVTILRVLHGARRRPPEFP